MSFGRRSFHSVARVDGEWRARMVPLDMAAPAEWVSSDDLAAALRTNAESCHPVDTSEERRAYDAILRALKKSG